MGDTIRAISLGLGARNLKDKDVFSKSDPFCCISKPSINGGFKQIRLSETKKNTLNPDWSDFYFKEDEVPGSDLSLNLKIEIYDDDGKKGMDKADKLLGQGFFSLKQLQAAAMVNSGLPIYDGKRQKPAGQLTVRHFKIHSGSSGAPNPGGYPASMGRQPQMPGSGGGGYPPHAGGYPPSTGGYPPNTGGYPPNTGGYPPNTGGYPAAGSPYPPNAGGYPPAQAGYNTGSPYPTGGYTGGYPGAPGGAPGYPAAPGAPGYPAAPGAFTGGFSMPGIPDSNLPRGPGFQ